MTRNIIKKQLLDSSTINHKDGYVTDFRDNLIPTISVADFFDDLNNGNGNELKSKFKALYSSSALCVNFFGFFKRHLDKFTIFGENDFKFAQFEKKLRTGLKGTSPNLDFYLENQNSIIGIESKFLEPLSLKQPYFSASYSDSFLTSIDSGLSSIINHYRNNNAPTHLDTAQLIKHSIGLLNTKSDRKAKLIYIYWQPTNSCDFIEYEQHQKELKVFIEQIKVIKCIEFHHLTYADFCDKFNNDTFFNEHIKKFKEKYQRPNI